MITHSDDPRIGQSVRRICSVREMDSTVGRRHECNRQYCNPLSEPVLIQRGELPEPAVAPNVFVCRFGSVHVCSEELCTLYTCDNTHTCCISGVQYAMGVSAYQSGDYKTWNAPQQSLAPMRSAVTVAVVKAIQIGAEQVKERAADMVRLLLYSTCRVQYNQQHYDTVMRQAADSCASYEKQQLLNKQLPVLTDRLRLYNYCTTVPLPLCIFVFDQALLDYYVAIITQTWFKVQKWYVAFMKPSNSRGSARLDVEKISLGVLYMMRAGHVYERVVALPRDEFLLYNLPQFHMLHRFGIEKSDVTCGMHIIEATFEHARMSNIPSGEIAIDISQLPQQQQQQQQQEEQPQAATAAATTRDVIIGTNGERLFMLSSRKYT